MDVASGSDGNGDDELSLPIESSVPDEIDESTHDGFFDSDVSFFYICTLLYIFLFNSLFDFSDLFFKKI